jgi:hypothetical protein
MSANPIVASKADPVLERIWSLSTKELLEIRLLVNGKSKRTSHFTVSDDGRIRRYGRGGQHIGSSDSIRTALQAVDEQILGANAPVAPVAPPAPIAPPIAVPATVPAVLTEPPAKGVATNNGEPLRTEIPDDSVTPAPPLAPDVPVAPGSTDLSTATNAYEPLSATIETSAIDVEPAEPGQSESAPRAPIAPTAQPAPVSSAEAGSPDASSQPSNLIGAVAGPVAPVAPATPVPSRDLRLWGFLVAGAVLSAGTIFAVILRHRDREAIPVPVAPTASVHSVAPMLPEPASIATEDVSITPALPLSRAAEAIDGWLSHTLLGTSRPKPYAGNEAVPIAAVEAAFSRDLSQLLNLVRIQEQNRNGVLLTAWRAANASTVRLTSDASGGLTIWISAVNPGAVLTALASFLDGQPRFQSRGIQIEVKEQIFEGPYVQFDHESLAGIARQKPGGVEIRLTFR